MGSGGRVETVVHMPVTKSSAQFRNPARRLHSPLQGQENFSKVLNGAVNQPPTRMVNQHGTLHHQNSMPF